MWVRRNNLIGAAFRTCTGGLQSYPAATRNVCRHLTILLASLRGACIRRTGSRGRQRFGMGNQTSVSRARHLCLVLVGVAALSATSCRRSALPSSAPLPRVEINGRTWRVEVASTRQQRYVGLSGRTSLTSDEGMLFVYPSASVLEFCMRGCVIPLDIAFVGSDMSVVSVQTMAVEPDLVGRSVYRSGAPAQYALEVSAGALGRAGVRVGDKVRLLGEMPAAAKAQDRP